MVFFVDAAALQQIALAALCLLSLQLLKLRIDARLGALSGGHPAAKPSRVELLSAFLDEAAAILGAAESSIAADADISARLDDFHGRVTVFLFKKFGVYTAWKLHDHRGFRRFFGAYPASLSSDRIRMCRHLQTDLRRLHEVMNRAESRSAADSRPQGREAA